MTFKCIALSMIALLLVACSPERQPPLSPPNIIYILPDGADPYALESYSDYFLSDYAPDIMFDRITDFVSKRQKEPFFLYWATPIPHVPLQAPSKWIDHYVEKFGDEELYLGNDSPWFNSAGPFREERGFGKGYLYAGGIRVPMIASWPAMIQAGLRSDHISAFYDVMPTLAEIAGVEQGFDTDGISFLPALREQKQPKHDYLYWEFPSYGGRMAVRMGKWKALRLNMDNDGSEWALFNLESDPMEQVDLAREYPELIAKVTEIVAEAHVPAANPRWRFSALGE